jgi:eukaryotic-like serine/threonine-protein kinase
MQAARAPAPRSMAPVPVTSTPATSPPSVVPGYDLVRKIGEGGSSEIYEATHLALAKRVAVKVLRKELAKDPLPLERARLEAQALARLDHPNILSVTDSGQATDGRPFLVMEYLAGVPLLRELRKRGCLPVDEAVELVQQVLAGLGAAHALGIVHRDIKLENLFLRDDEHGRRSIKILDFGIAKLIPGAEAAGAPAPLAIPSHEGLPIGTPRFLAPEQAMCRPVDARTDIYGVGMVLYELLVGRDPFHHVNDYVALLQAHVSEDPRPPSEAAPQPIDPALDDVVLRALAKRPDDRWASADQFSRALRSALAPQTQPSASSSSRRRSWALPALVVVTSALLSGLATLALCQVW